MSLHAKKNRNLGIDLLRALAMFLVLLWHFVGQGGLLAHTETGSVKYWVLSFVQILAICCPGCIQRVCDPVHPLAYWNADIIVLFRAWDSWSILTVCATMIGTAAALFVVCIFLGYLRQWLFRSLGIDRTIEILSGRIEHKVRTLLGD